MDSQQLTEKWINGTLTEEERALFEQTKEYQVLKRLSDATQYFRAPDFDIPVEFERLQVRMALKKEARIVAMAWFKPMMRVAAVLLVAAAAYFLLIPDSATSIKTLAAEKSTVYLPDSSAVRLNALSQLTYQARRWAQDRRVVLEGEAFFVVAKGSRFDVETTDGVVTVLGTEFSVNARSNFFEVVCFEGLVEVRRSGKITKLSPTKVFRVINNETVVSTTAEKLPGWLNNESSFESVPYGEVIEELGRQYAIHITTQHVDRQKLFTGRFTHSDLNKALQAITLPLNLTIKMSPDQKQVVISGEAK